MAIFKNKLIKLSLCVIVIIFITTITLLVNKSQDDEKEIYNYSLTIYDITIFILSIIGMLLIVSLFYKIKNI